MTELMQRILPTVQKPARYTGGEWGEIKKDLKDVRVRVAFCFPDTYEIGMSNLGMRILYGVMNGMDGVWCERVFAPWGDMEEELRRAGVPTRVVTTPRAVSLGCGLSVRFDRIALPIALQIYRARPSAARNLIGFYTAQELDGKLMIQSVRF